MGDNAKKSWEWHNTKVGDGYQARGVIRQPNQLSSTSIKIIDMTKSAVNTEIIDEVDNDPNEDDSTKRSKEKKKTKHKKRKRDERVSSGDKAGKFNPILQYLAKRLSDKTMEFS